MDDKTDGIKHQLSEDLQVVAGSLHIFKSQSSREMPSIDDEIALLQTIAKMIADNDIKTLQQFERRITRKPEIVHPEDLEIIDDNVENDEKVGTANYYIEFARRLNKRLHERYMP